MNNNLVRKITKSLLFSVFCIAFIFSCSLPETGNNAAVQGETTAKAVSTDFRAPSQDPPGGLTPDQVPQFVIFGWDDNQYADGMINIMNLYEGRMNPAASGNPYTFDGAPTSASFYVVPSGEDPSTGETWMTSDDAVDSWKLAYRKGHEIGNHTWSHQPGGLNRDYAGWLSQIQRAQDFMVARLGIPSTEMTGFRTPFLEYNASTFQAAETVGIKYDNSFESGWRYWPAEDGSTLFWPFTMDNGKPAGEEGREFGNVPGMWQMPTDCIYFEGGRTTGFDYNIWFSKTATKAEFVAMLKYSLDKKYNGNRSPMNFGTHTNYYSANGLADGMLYDSASWFKLKSTVQERIDGVKEFLDYAQTLPDVRIVSTDRALEWVKNPVALGSNPVVTYPITATASIGGFVSPEGTQNIIAGTSKTYSINANPGYILDSVLVNSVDMGAITVYTFNNVFSANSISASFREPTLETARKSSIMSMNAAAENSQTTLKFNYGENIGDGRGITFGAVGFCSGTYDGTFLLETLKTIDPNHFLVVNYLAAFQAIDALPHPGELCGDVTGLDNFIADFTTYGSDDSVIKAQLIEIEKLYYSPAEVKYQEIGGATAITMAVLYDTTVNHGANGMAAIADQTNAAMGGSPKSGVNEVSWIRNFLENRRNILLSDPVWAESIDRIAMFERVIDAGNTALTNPYDISCYGDNFTIYGTEVPFTDNVPKVAITISAGSNGTTSPAPGIISISQGSGITVTMIPDLEPVEYMVDQITVDGTVVGTGNSYDLVNVTTPTTLNVTFKLAPEPIYFPVTATAGSNGAISPAGSTEVRQGRYITYTFTPASNYLFDTVTVNGAVVEVTGLTYTIENVQAATLINATFVASPTCTLPAWDSSQIYKGDSALGANQGERVHHNEHDWRAKWWTQNQAPGTNNVWVDLGVCGEQITYDVTATAGPNGSISPALQTVPASSDISNLVATPASGYEIDQITVDGSVVMSLQLSNIQKDTAVSVTFKLEQAKVYFDVIISPAPVNGSITAPAQVEEGLTANIQIIAYTGYDVESVTVDGINVGAVTSYTLAPVNADVTISATFVGEQATVYYDVVISPTPVNGTITGPSQIEEGTSATFQITAAAGYAVEDVTVNGNSAGSVTSLTIDNVQEIQTISATFVEQSVQPWDAAGVHYALGAEVSHDGKIYICDYAHNSNSAWYPGAPGLWLWRLK